MGANGPFNWPLPFAPLQLRGGHDGARQSPCCSTHVPTLDGASQEPIQHWLPEAQHRLQPLLNASIFAKPSLRGRHSLINYAGRIRPARPADPRWCISPTGNRAETPGHHREPLL